MKKIFVFLMVMVLLCGSMPVMAVDNSRDYDSVYAEYNMLVEAGYLDSNVSFKEWESVMARSAQIESNLKDENYSFVQSRGADDEYVMKPGDVFVTNATISSGLTGHAGIAISSTEILHISGFGATPQVISFREWTNSYTSNGWTKVYRSNNSDIGSAAAEWVDLTYRGSDAEYKITVDLQSTDITYCSKIVWQGYCYGAYNLLDIQTGIILPYELDTTIPGLELYTIFGTGF